MPAKKEYKPDEVSCEVGGVISQSHSTCGQSIRMEHITICIKKDVLAPIISAFSENPSFSLAYDGVKALNLRNCAILAITDKKEYYRLIICGEIV